MLDTMIAALAVLIQSGNAGARADPEPPASPPPMARSYFSNTDYPEEALRREEQGTVEFEVDVSTEGRASACRIIASDAGETLNRATCDLILARARFIPARDREGRPTTDTLRSRVRWVLPQ